ncbi:hypothetical protein MKEN_00757600 [Mycena kentingensis (nom. inval.)]|nr:hypothetical protein MKEN_00757600 [Mycena kentingensis (nom. inval.)]
MPRDELEPPPPTRPRWVPVVLLTTGTVLTIGPLIFLWRARRSKSIALNAASAPPPRRVGLPAGTLPTSAEPVASTSAAATQEPAALDGGSGILSNFTAVFPWADTERISSSSPTPKYSSSYGLSSAWKDDDDDDWGVRPAPLDPAEEAKFNGALFTVKAFGIATLIVTSLGIGGIWGMVRYWEVDNMQDFGDKMRLEVISKMPFLAARMRNALDLSSPSPAKPPPSWSYDESQDRLSDAFDKGGISAWASAVAHEMEEETKVEVDKRERLRSRSNRP